MKTLRKNGGFTLVELIVVIAILAILAGVAVPAYSGYIKKANDAAVITQLDAIKTAAEAANATNATEISGITVTTTGKIQVANIINNKAYYEALASYLDATGIASDKIAADGVTWDDIKTTFGKENSYNGKGATYTGGKWSVTSSTSN